MLLSHNKQAILETVVQLLSSTNTPENTMGQQCVFLMINTQSSSKYITDVLEATLTFTNRIVLLKAFFNDKRVQGEYLTEDEFSAYQSNTFVLSYKLMFLEMYGCVFKPHHLVSQVDCIISQLENNHSNKDYIASITKRLSRLVHLDQNKKNKILGRLNEVYNKPTNNLEVDETSFSEERRSGNGDFGDFVSVKYKYSIFSALFGCFFKGLKRVFPLN